MSVIPNVTATSTRLYPGSSFTVTRPNNTTAYSVGQIYGAAADGRASVTAPAAPADLVNGYTGINLFVVLSRPGSVSPPGLGFTWFSAQPTTVLGDQANANFADADIALIMYAASGVQFSSSTGASLNSSADPNGRQFITFGLTLATGRLLAPGATYWFYVKATNAYTPIANETLTFFPTWVYDSKPLL